MAHDPATLPDALLRPEAYPHTPDHVEFHQTHVSWVYVAGDLVYKLKRPVCFPFVDYSTLERRRHFCEEEVRLNRRTAPDTYRGVVRVVRRSDGSLAIGGNDESGEVVEYAVEMERLPAEGMLDYRLKNGLATREEILRIADALIAFHRNCPTGPGVNEYATPEKVRETFDKTIAIARAHLAPVFADRIEKHVANALNLKLLHRRIKQARIRDGHGDLHAGNICFSSDGAPILYDCIEFDPALRCGDVAAEIAFLAMDLCRYGHADWSRQFILRYAIPTGDLELRELAALYAIRRALVRANVTNILAQETGDAETVAAARLYRQLAAAYALPPAVIAMCGPPASGKSRIAEAIARPLRAEVVRSDVERKRLSGMEPTERWLESRFEGDILEANRRVLHAGQA